MLLTARPCCLGQQAQGHAACFQAGQAQPTLWGVQPPRGGTRLPSRQRGEGSHLQKAAATLGQALYGAACAQPQPGKSQVCCCLPCTIRHAVTSLCSSLLTCRPASSSRWLRLPAVMGVSLAAAVIVLGLFAALGPPHRQQASVPLRQAMVISMFSRSAQQEGLAGRLGRAETLQAPFAVGDLQSVQPVNATDGSLDSLLQAAESAPNRPTSNDGAQFLYDVVRLPTSAWVLCTCRRWK